MTRLWHYTCEHGWRGIIKDQALRGNPHPLMPEVGPVIWLTDLDAPDRLGLGLTSFGLRCDRTEHQITVDTDRALHWPKAARTLCTPAVRRELNWAPGARPMHWWVVLGTEPLPLSVAA